MIFRINRPDQSVCGFHVCCPHLVGQIVEFCLQFLDSAPIQLLLIPAFLLFPHTDQIPAVFFGTIQCHIGTLYQLLLRTDFGFIGGDTDTDRDMYRVFIGLKKMTFNDRMKLCGECQGSFFVGVGNHHEFLTAVSTTNVHFTTVRFEEIGDLTKYLVTELMPIRVVDRFEMINIEKHTGKEYVVPTGPFHFKVESLLDESMIVQPGQSVGNRECHQFFIPLIQLIEQDFFGSQREFQITEGSTKVLLGLLAFGNVAQRARKPD